jgi:hypothetical protein
MNRKYLISLLTALSFPAVVGRLSLVMAYSVLVLHCSVPTHPIPPQFVNMKFTPRADQYIRFSHLILKCGWLKDADIHEGS